MNVKYLSLCFTLILINMYVFCIWRTTFERFVKSFVFIALTLPGREGGEAMMPHQTLSVNLIMFDTAGNYSQQICAAMRFGFPVTTDRVIWMYRGIHCLFTASGTKHVIDRNISSNVVRVIFVTHSNIIFQFEIWTVYVPFSAVSML